MGGEKVGSHSRVDSNIFVTSTPNGLRLRNAQTVEERVHGAVALGHLACENEDNQAGKRNEKMLGRG